MGAYVEMHAAPLSGDGEVTLARCGDGDDDDSCYRCAIELARMVGTTGWIEPEQNAPVEAANER
jgi:hypothetical protein